MQRGAARAERAVGQELQRADHHAAVAESLGPALAGSASHVEASSGRRPPRSCGTGTRPRSTQPPVDGERVEVDAHLVDAGEALGQALRDGVAHGAVEALVGRRAAPPRWTSRCAVSTRSPVGSPRGVADDEAARRDRACGASMPAAAQRRRVRPGRVAVDADERDRMIRRRAIERGAGRKAPARPEVLVPAAAGDPLAARAVAPRARPRAGRSPPRSRAAQRRASAGPRQVHQVPVRVDEPGQHRAPAEVERWPRPAPALTSARRPANAMRPSRTTSVSTTVPRGVQRVDPAVGQQHRPVMLHGRPRGRRSSFSSAMGSVALSETVTRGGARRGRRTVADKTWHSLSRRFSGTTARGCTTSARLRAPAAPPRSSAAASPVCRRT